LDQLLEELFSHFIHNYSLIKEMREEPKKEVDKVQKNQVTLFDAF
jgi:hypothetical protein